MPIANKMNKLVEGSSMIRKMFEEGNRLKEKYGDEKVYDLSLGNPDVPPPKEFKSVLKELANDESLKHCYMPNQGYLHVREAVAHYLKREHGWDVTSDLIVMTVGAGGALNNIFCALINPGEEILVPSPYFVGYEQYAFSANATIKTVPSDEKFHLDINGIEDAISDKTRLVLINSPNNPTGVIYSAGEIKQLGEVLEKASKKYGKRVYLISDEPYRNMAYNKIVPSVFKYYPHSIIVTSYSKELSLAGERIGYCAINPMAEDAALVVAAVTTANTMLYVNAPSLFQLAIAKLQGITVDVSIYKRRRDILCDGLADAGYSFNVPDGSFFLFPRSPIPDDIQFVQILRDELILVVPGSSFGRSGHFRISYAVPDAIINGSLDGFKRAIDKV